LYGFLNQQKKAMRYGLRIIPQIDLLFIVLEALTLIAFIILKLLESDVAHKSALYLLFGEPSVIFWFGVVVLGIISPLVISFFSRLSAQSAKWAIDSLAILIGGLALRYALITAGLHLTSSQLYSWSFLF
jgi:formate-dependent nitrite reductase membrane component NrfD